MRHVLGFSRIAQDSKIDARERVKMRHFRTKSQHLDTLFCACFQIPRGSHQNTIVKSEVFSKNILRLVWEPTVSHIRHHLLYHALGQSAILNL